MQIKKNPHERALFGMEWVLNRCKMLKKSFRAAMSHLKNILQTYTHGIAMKRHILNPLLWLIGILLFSVTSVAFTDNDVAKYILVVLIVLIFIVISFALYVFHYFMKVDPDRLQTESYQLKKQ